MAAEVVAVEQVCRLRAGVNSCASVQPGAGKTIDVVLRNPAPPPLPGTAAVVAGEDRTVVQPGEDRTAFGFDQEGMDVLVGPRSVRDVPPWAGGIALQTCHALDGADQHLMGGC